MQIAKNPLSKKLSQIFGSKHNKEFKNRVYEIRRKLEEKYPSEGKCELTDGSIKNWIAQSKDNEKLPHRWPSIANLVKLADVLEIEFWDFFIDREQYLNLQKINPTQKRIIEKVLVLEKLDLLVSAERAIDDQITIQGLQKEKVSQKNEIPSHAILNSVVDKN